VVAISQTLSSNRSRFVVNIPSEELVSVPRICFQIEQAHWFYEDFIRVQNPRLPSLSLRKFSKCIFDQCPLLWEYSGSHEKEFEDFLRYKKRVPVLGGILLDPTWEMVRQLERKLMIGHSRKKLQGRDLVISQRQNQ
jgi:mRNA-decapping enzyme subunit 2